MRRDPGPPCRNPDRRRVFVPYRDIANALEPITARADMRLEHRLHARPEPKLGPADDARAKPRRSVQPARALRSDAVDELGLADRAQLFRPVGAIHGMAVDRDCRDDIVPAAGIGEQFWEKILPVIERPHMMMRVDDR